MTRESPESTYEKWYPDVPPVMDSRQLAELLSSSDQVIRAWAREGVIPAHRPPGGRKFKFLRHEIFAWLVESRYVPEDDSCGHSASVTRHEQWPTQYLVAAPSGPIWRSPGGPRPGVGVVMCEVSATNCLSRDRKAAVG